MNDPLEHLIADIENAGPTDVVLRGQTLAMQEIPDRLLRMRAPEFASITVRCSYEFACQLRDESEIAINARRRAVGETQ